MLIFCEIFVKYQIYVIIRQGSDIMPATYTHHAFAKDVYKIINPNIQDKLKDSKDIFEIFSKSFDILFFINGKLGHHAHYNNVNLYFKNIINYIKENNLTNNSETLAYIYGSICHYVLDSTAHPYIFYKTGQYKQTKETAKYKGKHSYIEYMIDAIMYNEKEPKPIYRANLKKELFSKITFTKELEETINYAFLETFNTKNVAKLFKRGYKNYKLILKHIMTSRFGIKKVFYKILDFTKIYKKYEVSNMCYHIKKLDYSTLNLDHQQWFYPVSKEINYHYSFYDLYDIALEKAKTIINTLDSALNSNEEELNKTIKEIGNLGYSTGIDCDKKLKMQYFEY